MTWRNRIQTVPLESAPEVGFYGLLAFGGAMAVMGTKTSMNLVQRE